MSDHYRLLGIERRAPAAEIKRAYRRLARRWHPDLNPGDERAEAVFKRIREAYEVLADPVRREKYDRWSGPAADIGETAPRRGGSCGTDGDGLDRSPAPAADPARGEDIHTTIDIGFLDAVRGLTTRILVRREVACAQCGGRAAGPGRRRSRCPGCGGTGQRRGSGLFRRSPRPCPGCGGAGTVEVAGCVTCGGRGRSIAEETLAVRIPAGVDNGSRVRVPGKGHAGKDGAAPGDLYVITRVAPHRRFEREGDNLLIKVPITIPEALLGARIAVPTVDGRATIKVPQGTPPGRRFRLAGRGVPSLHTGRRGDQFVEVELVVPRLSDERSREIVRELGRLNAADPRRDLFE